MAREAMGIARRFDDRDLEFAAQALVGHAYVASGRVAKGKSLIDEAMAAVAGGEVSAVESIGEIYCRLLGACQRAADVRRTKEWMVCGWGDLRRGARSCISSTATPGGGRSGNASDGRGTRLVRHYRLVIFDGLDDRVVIPVLLTGPPVRA